MRFSYYNLDKDDIGKNIVTLRRRSCLRFTLIIS